ncbi:hypothetical protein [Lignipirellula cremea]|uniref:hypothetical protein n=1 Tax=Lignipirellula cremea TaxID=2528010 RepID=UPI0011A96922|nr:hypothetical protein [Lignipirellula cremea]
MLRAGEKGECRIALRENYNPFSQLALSLREAPARPLAQQAKNQRSPAISAKKTDKKWQNACKAFGNSYFRSCLLSRFLIPLYGQVRFEVRSKEINRIAT